MLWEIWIIDVQSWSGHEPGNLRFVLVCEVIPLLLNEPVQVCEVWGSSFSSFCRGSSPRQEEWKGRRSWKSHLKVLTLNGFHKQALSWTALLVRLKLRQTISVIPFTPSNLLSITNLWQFCGESLDGNGYKHKPHIWLGLWLVSFCKLVCVHR